MANSISNILSKVESVVDTALKMPDIKDNMRGLSVFISDIRACKSQEAEIKRVNKELANIRSKFKEKTVDGYTKKKYIAKLTFIYLLGHEFDFGHLEAINLLTSTKYSEKHMGYLFVSVVFNESSELQPMLVANLKTDLLCSNAVYCGLALQCLANIANPEMAEQFFPDVLKILLHGTHPTDTLKQMSCLVLVKFIRIFPVCSQNCIEVGSQLSQLLNNPNLSLVLASISLLKELSCLHPEQFTSIIPIAISRLLRFVKSSSQEMPDYSYYFVPAPWIQVGLLQLLQCFSLTVDSPGINELCEAIDITFVKSQDPPKSKKVHHTNIKFALIVSSIDVLATSSISNSLFSKACSILSTFLTSRDPNLRNLSLELYCKMSKLDTAQDSIIKHQSTIIELLKTDKDYSIRQKCVDVLYSICNQECAEMIISEILSALKSMDLFSRQDTVIKVAILSEKFASDFRWYFDNMMTLFHLGNEFVSDDVWYRLLQIVINREEIQEYAATQSFNQLCLPEFFDTTVKVCSYILGEYGNLISDKSDSLPTSQVQILIDKYPFVSLQTKLIIINSHAKMVNLFPSVRSQVEKFFRSEQLYRSSDIEIQQRVHEYLNLFTFLSADTLATILEIMPAFPENRSNLFTKLKKTSQSPIQNNTVDNSLLQTNSTMISATEEDLSKECANRLLKFLYCDKALIYENDVIQVGGEILCNQTNAKLHLYIGNKLGISLNNIDLRLDNDSSYINMELVDQINTIKEKSQVKVSINVECVQDFSQYSSLRFSFKTNDKFYCYKIPLPISVLKFCSPYEMNSSDFFIRWKNLSIPEYEYEKILTLANEVNSSHIKNKLIGAKFSVLDNVDPNPNNFVGAAVVNTKSGPFGIIFRIEVQSKTYKMNFKSSRLGLSKLMASIFEKLILL